MFCQKLFELVEPVFSIFKFPKTVPLVIIGYKHGIRSTIFELVLVQRELAVGDGAVLLAVDQQNRTLQLIHHPDGRHIVEIKIIRAFDEFFPFFAVAAFEKLTIKP